MENESASSHGSIPDDAQRFISELDKATSHIIADINKWLSNLHGILYPVEAIEDIERIRDVVRRAGCQLFYGDTPVGFYYHTHPRAKNVTFQLKLVGERGTKNLYSRTMFPPLSARPYGISGNTES